MVIYCKSNEPSLLSVWDVDGSPCSGTGQLCGPGQTSLSIAAVLCTWISASTVSLCHCGCDQCNQHFPEDIHICCLYSSSFSMAPPGNASPCTRLTAPPKRLVEKIASGRGCNPSDSGVQPLSQWDNSNPSVCKDFMRTCCGEEDTSF